ncbi:hypothetical protein [Gloeobacter morelensis]|uniref:hypothetical protein n=1 Tax=Gloeobacter morelensis TaxID=2907343 RepID=UPI001E57E61B|nr:hypothetical protein [Gloeobacter morelensis]UFP97227.1 hypothetical protein ISF26_24200 [Gloeobacter morelensis MG652769]
MSLPSCKFESFWDEQPTLATGWGNVNLKLETVAVGLVSIAIGWFLWGKLGFAVFIPGVRFDFGVLGPLASALPFFISFKLATMKRSLFDVAESLVGALITPEVVASPDCELVPTTVD